MISSRTAKLGERLRSILLRLKSGEEAALRELMTAMGNRVYREAWLQLRNEQDAQEAANLIFFKLWAKASYYNPDKPALPYVISVARNYCRDLLRHKSRRHVAASLEEDIAVNALTVHYPYTEGLVLDFMLPKKEAGIAKSALCPGKATEQELFESEGAEAEDIVTVIEKVALKLLE